MNKSLTEQLKMELGTVSEGKSEIKPTVSDNLEKASKLFDDAKIKHTTKDGKWILDDKDTEKAMKLMNKAKIAHIFIGEASVNDLGELPNKGDKENVVEADKGHVIQVKVSAETLSLINRDKKKEFKPMLDKLAKDIKASVTSTSI